jgi:YggT family protein
MDGITGVVSLALLIDWVIRIYIWILIASAILSWLVAFDVVNRRSPFVSKVGLFLYRATEPVLRPVRRVVPLIAGVDLSPLIVILLLWFIRNLLFEYVLF